MDDLLRRAPRAASFLALISLLWLSGCAPLPTPAPIPTPTEEALYRGTDGYPWWNDAVFYEIFVRSFYDSDGDGVGDFNGITAKLDYLNDGNPSTNTDLGVTGIWLMPIFPSPSYHGYDVTDYFAVNPQYGTLEDFTRLLDEAHARGIRVIIDMVLNHTSDQHPWFKEAKRDPASPYRDWYIWSQDDPGYAGPWGQRVWHPSRSGYYYGLFEAFMPDLNYNNPAVTAQMNEVVRFWLEDVGVDGFRLDAAKHLIEDGQRQQNTEATHEWFQDFRPVYKGYNPYAVTVGEFFGDDLPVIDSYTEGDQLDLAFHFDLASAFINSVNSARVGEARDMLRFSEKLLTPLQYAPFLTNHDQNRAMNQLGNDVNKARVAASLLLTSPGVPFIYYGEEIGMSGTKPDENIRRPMQWSEAQNAGFSVGRPWRLPDSNYASVNVAAQTDDPASLLWRYRTLIALRNAHPALRVGRFFAVSSGNSALFASLRVSSDEAVLVLINLSEATISDYSLSLEESTLGEGEYALSALMGAAAPTTLTADAAGGFSAARPLEEIPPYATVILVLAP